MASVASNPGICHHGLDVGVGVGVTVTVGVTVGVVTGVIVGVGVGVGVTGTTVFTAIANILNDPVSAL